MTNALMPYIKSILQACLVFPLIAGVITLPFLIRNYRKFGGIAIMRVLMVYSFILYQLCAFLLTVLPLPGREAAAAMPPKPIGWVPFTDLMVGLRKNGIRLSAAASLFEWTNWKNFFTSRDCFQIVANIVMQIPLGFYLRYYFRRSRKQCLLIGFCVSLFYEVTQYTGLWFLYPHAYRYASVDDLINNTLGCMIGFWLTPLLAWILPSRDEIDRISYSKGQRITLMRRIVALLIDWIIFGAFSFGGTYAFSMFGGAIPITIPVGELIWLVIYFMVIPWITRGKTLGHAVLKLKISREDNTPPKLRDLFIRYGLLYIVEPFLFFGAVFIGIALMAVFFVDGLTMGLRIFFIICGAAAMSLCVRFPVKCWTRYKTFPHGHYSHTTIVLANQKQKPIETNE